MTNSANAPTGPRIRPWPVKLAYIAASAAVVYLIAAIPVGSSGAGILRSALAFVLILIAARLFRGAREELEPPRPWWRMTGGVQSGVVLGILFALIGISSATGYIGLSLSPVGKQVTTNLPALLVNTVLSVVLAYLYFGSSRRIVLARRAQLLSIASQNPLA